MSAQSNKPQCKNTNEIKENDIPIAKSGTVRPIEKIASGI
jgi:hypothetical protein